jgi:phosphopantothenate synthetase
MVGDPAGRRSVFLDEARAELAAVNQHGIKTALRRAEPGETAVAWLIAGGRGARFIVLRGERAHQLAREMHGTAHGLAPMTPLPNPDPDKET